MKKMIFVIIGIIGLLTVLIFTGRKSVSHEITINATPEQVWNVLMDMDKYPEWNPTMQILEGEVNIDAKVKYQFTQDEHNISKIGATVEQIIPNKLLNQKGGMPLILTFNHKYVIEPNGKQTKVIIHEKYRGIGVNFWNPEPVEKAYGRLNEALKIEVENLNK